MKHWLHRGGLTIAVLGAAATGLVACGGDDDDSSSAAAPAPATTQAAAAPAAAKPTGTPFKIMAIAPVGTPIQDYPDIVAAAKAAADDVNAKGGVAGHPVEIITCNDKSDPNGAQACARQAVSDKVAAVTSSSVNGVTMYPTLTRAGIPVVPGASTPADWSTAGVYPLSLGSTASSSAAVSVFKSLGKKKVAVVRTDISATTYKVPEVKLAVQRAGLTFAGEVKIPVDATDLSPYLQQLKNTGADAVTTLTTSQQSIGVIKLAKQLGLDVTFAGNPGTIGANEIKELGDEGNGLILTDGTPAPGAVGIAAVDAFNAGMKKAADAGVEGADKLNARTVESWLNVYALADVVKAAKPTGDITAKTVTDAIKGADTVDVEGVYEWRPNATGPKAYPHIANGLLYVGTVKDGKVEIAPDKLDHYGFLGLEPQG